MVTSWFFLHSLSKRIFWLSEAGAGFQQLECFLSPNPQFQSTVGKFSNLYTSDNQITLVLPVINHHLILHILIQYIVCRGRVTTISGVLGGIRRIPTSWFFWQRILTSVIINKQGTFRTFATPLCVYPPPFLAIHHWLLYYVHKLDVQRINTKWRAWL